MKGFTVGELVVIFALVIVIGVLVYPFAMDIREKSDKVACLNNMREMGRALYIYAKEHQGKFPDTLEELYAAQYIADHNILDCPSSRHRGTRQEPDYEYFPGHTVNDGSGENLLADKTDNHREGRNILKVDGNIVWETAPEK